MQIFHHENGSRYIWNILTILPSFSRFRLKNSEMGLQEINAYEATIAFERYPSMRKDFG
jgi:hypothetical protein